MSEIPRLPQPTGAPLPFTLPVRPSPFGGIGGLKTAKKQVKFILRDDLCVLESSIKQSPDDRMRFIDTIKLYKPLQDECEQLNIPDIRLDISIIHNLILLCGGCVGFRIGIDEFPILKQLTEDLQVSYARVVNKFQTLNSIDKKKKMTDDIIQLHHPLLSIDSRNSSDAAYNGNADDAYNDVIEFHMLSDTFMKVVSKVQSFVIAKLSDVTSSIINSDFTATHTDNIVVISKDPDGNIGKKLPTWLTVLISKYHSIVSDSKSKPSVGKLAAFISCCIVKNIDLTCIESSAVQELLEASSDTTYTHIDNVFISSDNSSNNYGSSNSCKLYNASQKYWANRVFHFLSSLSEMKSYVHDDKNVFNFNVYYH